ncbi:MAG: diacylglycerol kinase [Chromatiales bacterium]|nr:diacylglycerol kinase [Chromatiales bacterium]
MANQNAKGLQRLINATGYSYQGFKAAFQHEEAFRQEVMLCLLLAPLGIWLGETGVERALLVGSLFVVLLTELLNSAVEAAIDRFGGERHELSGRAKDIASAAVFTSLGLVVCVWGLVLIT